MRGTEANCGRVVAVLLADGWHHIVPGSFSVGPLGLGGYTEPASPGFRFQEARAGSPHPPGVLAGPLDSIIAVRQMASASTAARDGTWEPAALNGHRPNHGMRQPALAVR
jgi:hypothetical protein